MKFKATYEVELEIEAPSRKKAQEIADSIKFQHDSFGNSSSVKTISCTQQPLIYNKKSGSFVPKYEVIYTDFDDIGLLLENNEFSHPKRVLARNNSLNPDGRNPEYDGAEFVHWNHSGVYLTKEEWKHISYSKPVSSIFEELGINTEQKTMSSYKL